MTAFIVNTSKFFNIASECQKGLQDGESLFGEEIHLTESVHADGRTRRAESGRKINVNFLRNKGIDPLKVLFFRITQEAKIPKPEYYWTTDYFETQKGLMREIPVEQRKSAITLVASLEAINNNGGLIQDINDDNGLAVRQIGTESFDQDLAIAKFTPLFFTEARTWDMADFFLGGVSLFFPSSTLLSPPFSAATVLFF